LQRPCEQPGSDSKVRLQRRRCDNRHEKSRLLTKNELVREIADKEGVEAALRYYGESYPKMAMGGESLLNVERYLKRRVELDCVQQQKQRLNCRTSKNFHCTVVQS